MSAADLDQIGEDLRELVRQRIGEIVSIQRVSTLVSPAWGNAAYRVETADGLVWKGRRFQSIDTAAEIIDLGRLLPPQWVPAMLASHGTAALYEWVDGAPPTASPVDPLVLRSAGAFLREVHRAVVPEQMAIDRSWPGVYPGPDWYRFLHDNVDRLRSSGCLDASEGARALALAARYLPRTRATGLVHGDLAPENIVIAGGALRVVDNDAVGIHAPQFDLARTWYRWSMTDDERRVFEDGYGDRDAIESYDACFPHWAIVVLVGAAEFRVRFALAGVGRPIARLREVLARW